MDSTTYLRSRIPGYAELLDEERRAIQEFSLLWSAFEGLMFDRRADVGKLLSLAEDLKVAQQLTDMKAFEEPLKFWGDRYFPGGQQSPHWPSLHMNRTTKKNYRLVVDVLIEVERQPVHILQALLLIVYRLRNNLFHGEKWAYGIAGQRPNFDHACKVMMATIDLRERRS